MTVQATDATTTSATHMDTASNISVSTRSRSRADSLAERMEVHMQMEAIRAEVRESLSSQRNSLLSSSAGATDYAPSAVEQQKPWEVVEMLGKGATGEVFKCKWRGLTVAIKQINFQVIYII